MIRLKLRRKYTCGGFDTGNHGKCTGAGLRDGKIRKQKHKIMPILRGSRAQAFN